VAVAIAAAAAAAISSTATAAISTAAAATTAASAASASTSAAISSAAALALRALAGFAHHESPAAAILAVQAVDRSAHVSVVGHLHETEAARATGLSIHNHFRSGNIAILPEQRLKIRRGVRPGQVAHIDPLSHFRQVPYIKARNKN